MSIKYPEGFYHIISRNNGPPSSFQTEAYFARSIGHLESAADRYGARIHCFCLMPNHCHILLETARSNLTTILRRVNMGDTKCLTATSEREDEPFQGQCRVMLIDKDSRLLELSRYIHLNPVRVHLVSDPSQYPWSSYLAYLGIEKRWDWLHTRFILGQLGSNEKEAQRRYRNYIWGAVREIVGDPLEKAVTDTQAFRGRVNQVIDPNGLRKRM